MKLKCVPCFCVPYLDMFWIIMIRYERKIPIRRQGFYQDGYGIYLLSCTPGRTRTFNQWLKRPLLYHWATGARSKFSLRFSKNKKTLKNATISVAINFVHVLYLWASFWWIFLKEVLKKEDDKWIKVDIKLIQLFEKASGWR